VGKFDPQKADRNLYGCKFRIHTADTTLTSQETVNKVEKVIRRVEANEKLEGANKINSIATHLEDFVKNLNKITKQPKLSKMYINGQNNPKKKGKQKMKEMEIAGLMSNEKSVNEGHSQPSHNVVKPRNKQTKKNAKQNTSMLLQETDK